MTFSPRALVYFAGFVAAVAVAVNADAAGGARWIGLAGLGAIVLVDWVLTFWPAGRRGTQPTTRSMS